MKYLLAPLLFAFVVQASPPATVPSLTTEQKLQVQVISQRLEIAQLKAQAAQRDFDSARQDLQALLKTLEKDGYTLDLTTLAYTTKPALAK